MRIPVVLREAEVREGVGKTGDLLQLEDEGLLLVRLRCEWGGQGGREGQCGTRGKGKGGKGRTIPSARSCTGGAATGTGRAPPIGGGWLLPITTGTLVEAGPAEGAGGAGGGFGLEKERSE